MTLYLSNLEADVQNTTIGPVVERVSARAAKSRVSSLYGSFFKRVLDVSLVVLSLPVVVPLILVMAVFIMIGGGMPFYSQLRIGKGGRHFRIWKLRTMVKNADEQLNTYLEQNPSAHREWLTSQKLKNDPRITRLGRLMRKTSMDELPQLWNVLTGTMSLVGPRPIMIEQEKYYFGRSYYHMRPGITGLWQISDRNDCSFVERVTYDDAYARTVSFATDLRTLLKTVGVVLRATGH